MGLTGSAKALMYAQGGVARGGATRGGYTDNRLYLTINGQQVATTHPPGARVRMKNISITDVLNETPNTCAFDVLGLAPALGSDLVMTLGSINRLTRLFAGTVLTVTQAALADNPAHVVYHVSGIDYTWGLNGEKVVAGYTATSATAIVLDLLQRFTHGYTTVHVQAGLAVLDETTFTNQDVTDALSQIARRVGGYWSIDYHRDLHFFVGDDPQIPNPRPLTPAHPTLSPNPTFRRDLSQMITRMYVEGGGTNATADRLRPGDTMIPVEDAVWYPAGGGVVAVGPQRVAYSAVSAGGGGGLVGLGASPTAAPALTLVAGPGVLAAGVYQYAFTDVTATGESLPSPVAAVTTGTVVTGVVTPPASAPTITLNRSVNTTGYFSLGDSVTVRVSYMNAAGETTLGPLSNAVTIQSQTNPPFPTVPCGIDMTGIPVSADGTVTAKHVFIYQNGNFHTLYFLCSNATTSLSWTQVNGPGAPSPPTSNTATKTGTFNQVGLTAIAVGATGTTARKVYRTAVGGSQLKFLTTIADNTTTTYTDNTADGSLGANAPTQDTSGLMAGPPGQVIAGSTTLLTSGTGGFSATGGWAVIGNGTQVIRYTGLSGNTLIGIPATGPGAIVASISYNSTITAAAVLLGIPASGPGAITWPIHQGDPVNIVAQVDDLTAQAQLKALLGGAATGIISAYVQDNRLSYTEAYARAQAQLALHHEIDVDVNYTCRDPNSRSGLTITANFPAPTSFVGTFKIQAVHIGGFEFPAPTYTVQASSTRFTLEDLLRLARAQQQQQGPT